jgi:hypothetical protein
MYQYVEIIAESPLVTIEKGAFLEMFVSNSDRKLPVIGIVKQISILADKQSVIQLRIQAQTGGDFAPISLLHEGSLLTLSTGFRKVEFGKATVTQRWFEPATRNSWQNTPIPDSNKTELKYEKVFTQKEYDRIKLGQLSEVMEEHWFAYFEKDCFYWFRSWTGTGVFEVYLEPQTNGAGVIKTIGNNDSTFDARLTSVKRLSGLMDGLTWHGDQIFDV